ncbi:aldo/keto reductase [Streptomyces sp. NPDC047123]|uniref:aldo/keto reductase n=1 Tax=Streptomyces sp. NPDC047123 TaxID=3155622 RepID=UPI0033E478D1
MPPTPARKGAPTSWLRTVRAEGGNACLECAPGSGFLTGTIDSSTSLADDDLRRLLPRFSPEARQANQVLVDLLRQIADDKGATPAQIALAWLLAQKPWCVPIPGTTKPHRLEENLGALDVELTTGDLHRTEEAAADIRIQGDRLPEQWQSRFGR